MRRPRLTAAMALATATIVTVAGCSTQIGGTASPAITGGATTSSSSTGSTSTSSSTSSSSESSSSSSESTSSAEPSSDSSATATTAESTTSPSTSDDIPTDIPTDLPTDFPTFSQDFPAGWPAELQLPAGATIITSTESGGEMSVTFQGTGSGADLMAALDANAVAAGFTQTSADAASGAYTASYSKSGSTLEISLLEYGGTAFGSLVISPA